jgi:hypothetical protein
MEPAELLGVLPTCAFGRYAASKFAALLPPRVEEAVLGDGEHRKAVSGGAHPRTPFYEEFLREKGIQILCGYAIYGSSAVVGVDIVCWNPTVRQASGSS